jgi:hypothetical protein
MQAKASNNERITVTLYQRGVGWSIEAPTVGRVEEIWSQLEELYAKHPGFHPDDPRKVRDRSRGNPGPGQFNR